MRKIPRPPLHERDVPAWPPNKRKLVVHENGCLQDPTRYLLAYCPDCLLPMHPSYFPTHKLVKECESFQLELVEVVQRS